MYSLPSSSHPINRSNRFVWKTSVWTPFVKSSPPFLKESSLKGKTKKKNFLPFSIQIFSRCSFLLPTKISFLSTIVRVRYISVRDGEREREREREKKTRFFVPVPRGDTINFFKIPRFGSRISNLERWNAAPKKESEKAERKERRLLSITFLIETEISKTRENDSSVNIIKESGGRKTKIIPACVRVFVRLCECVCLERGREKRERER